MKGLRHFFPVENLTEIEMFPGNTLKILPSSYLSKTVLWQSQPAVVNSVAQTNLS